MSMILSCVFTSASSLALTILKRPFSRARPLIQPSSFGGMSEKPCTSNDKGNSFEVCFDCSVDTPLTSKDEISSQISFDTK